MNYQAIMRIFVAVLTGLQVHSFAPRPVRTTRAASQDTLVKLKMFEGNNRNNENSMESRKAGGNGNDNFNSNKYSFASGRDLELLRAKLECFRETLQWAQESGDQGRMAYLSQEIEKLEVRDPDVVYAKALAEIQQRKNSASIQAFTDKSDGQEVPVENWIEEAALPRSCLPRFQMEGLWVGNYGVHGLELINVTYDGDTLVAKKVTGDENVPRGRVTFTADLTPQLNHTTMQLPLKIVLTNTSSIYKYPSLDDRFSGKGKIARSGFKESQFIDGQLIVWEDSFSFVWIGLPPQTSETAEYYNDKFHQVHFRRPTPDQIFSLMRNVLSKEDELENMRAHLRRCFVLHVKESSAQDHVNGGGKMKPFRRISTREELEASGQRQQKARVVPKDAQTSSPPPFNLKSIVNEFDELDSYSA